MSFLFSSKTRKNRTKSIDFDGKVQSFLWLFVRKLRCWKLNSTLSSDVVVGRFLVVYTSVRSQIQNWCVQIHQSFDQSYRIKPSKSLQMFIRMLPSLNSVKIKLKINFRTAETPRALVIAFGLHVMVAGQLSFFFFIEIWEVKGVREVFKRKQAYALRGHAKMHQDVIFICFVQFSSLKRYVGTRIHWHWHQTTIWTFSKFSGGIASTPWQGSFYQLKK